MKVAVSSKGKTLDSEMDEFFGRCPYFIIADTDNMDKFEAIENISATKPGGAGIAAAKAVVDKGVDAVISGNFGPRALDVLKQFKIEIYKAAGKVKDALEKLKKGKLEKVEQ